MIRRDSHQKNGLLELGFEPAVFQMIEESTPTNCISDCGESNCSVFSSKRQLTSPDSFVESGQICGSSRVHWLSTSCAPSMSLPKSSPLLCRRRPWWRSRLRRLLGRRQKFETEFQTVAFDFFLFRANSATKKKKKKKKEFRKGRRQDGDDVDDDDDDVDPSEVKKEMKQNQNLAAFFSKSLTEQLMERL